MLTLQDLYGEISDQTSIQGLITRGIRSIFCQTSKNCTFSIDQICKETGLDSESLKSLFTLIFDYLNNSIGSDINQLTSLEEQQERELQKEVQQEKQTVRPGRRNPCKSPERISDAVLEFVRSGTFNERLLPLPYALKHCEIWKLVETGGWSDRIRVSEDFTQVVMETRSLDQYLRPPNWIVSYSEKKKTSSIR